MLRRAPATLHYAPLLGGIYELRVEPTVRSRAGLPMNSAFWTQFIGVEDFSAFVRIEFATTRSDRLNGTVSHDLRVTNTSDFDLLAPLTLMLDPARYFQLLPAGSFQTSDDGLWLIDLGQTLTDGRLRPGESTVTRTITFSNPSAQRASVGHGIYALPYPNSVPLFGSTAPQSAAVGAQYEYVVRATDPDGIALSYLLMDAPPGVVLNASTGPLTWTPDANTPAQVSMSVRAYDTRGGHATQAFTIDVAGGNHAPLVGPMAAEIRGSEGRRLQIGLSVSRSRRRSTHVPCGIIFRREPCLTTIVG